MWTLGNSPLSGKGEELEGRSLCARDSWTFSTNMPTRERGFAADRSPGSVLLLLLSRKIPLTRRRLTREDGNSRPQLAHLLKPPTLPPGVRGADRGDESFMRCANEGIRFSIGVSSGFLAVAYRVHSSAAGSAFGVLKADSGRLASGRSATSFCDELTGDELCGRLLLCRGVRSGCELFAIQPISSTGDSSCGVGLRKASSAFPIRSARGRRIAGVEGKGLSCTVLMGDDGASSCFTGDAGAVVEVSFSLSGWRANSKAFNLDLVSVEGWIGGFGGGAGLLVASFIEGFLSKLRLPCHRALDCRGLVFYRRVLGWRIPTFEP